MVHHAPKVINVT